MTNFRFERRDLPRLRNVLNLPEIIVTEAGDRVEGKLKQIGILHRFMINLWYLAKLKTIN